MKVALTLALLALVSMPAYAVETSTPNNYNPTTLSAQTEKEIREHTHSVNVSQEDNTDRFRQWLSIDAPKLVRLSKKWTTGPEVGVRLDSGQVGDEIVALWRFTYEGTVVDLSKKEQ